MRIFYILIFIGFSLYGSGQSQVNLIPNPGFESFSSFPVGWFYTGKHFSSVVKYWSSPTAASPDAYGPNVSVPKYWKDKGFGKAPPHNGLAMAGITVYGCGDGKPHCREYIQVPLIEPLVSGQRYGFSVWIRKLDDGYETNNLGVSFASDKTYIDNDKSLKNEPVYLFSKSNKREDQWQKLTGEFIADDVKDFIIIGNFNNDDETRIVSPRHHSLHFGYYYIDDVELKKLEPILPIPNRTSSWENETIVEGASYRLNDIYFDTDMAELLPKSFIELNKLAELMKKYPNMIIEVDGHTDDQGDKLYNHVLSVNRAKAVVDYLNESGVAAERTISKGFGKNAPIASNNTAEGRQLNRRVEFKVIKM